MNIIEHTKAVVEKILAAQGKQGKNLPTLLEDYLEDLQSGFAPDIAMAIYNSLLCHIDLFSDRVDFKNTHKSIASKACAKARKAQGQSSKLVDIVKQHITIRSDMSRVYGVNKIVPYADNCGVITPYFDVNEIPEAVIFGCTHLAIGNQTSLDAGILLNLGLRFAGARFEPTLPGASQEEFNNVIDVLIEACNNVYGFQSTRELLVDIVKATLEDCTQNEINLTVKYSIPDLAGASVEELINRVLSDDGGYNLGLLYPIAGKLVQAWIRVINNSCNETVKAFRIGLVSLEQLFSSKDGQNKHTVISSLTKSFLAAENTVAQAKVEGSAGKFAVPYLWDCSFKGKGGASNFTFTLDNVIEDSPFCVPGDYKIEFSTKRQTSFPEVSSYYQCDKDTNNKLPNWANINDVFAVVFQTDKPSISTWGDILTKSDASTILPYLDFLPGQEQDSETNIILCKINDSPIGAVKNALESKQAAHVFIKLKSSWNEAC